MTENTSLVVRSPQDCALHYQEYRQALRTDFWFSCAYCTITEVEAQGLRFTIDHYLAKKKRPDLEAAYENLMWCCDACNTMKGDLWPDAELEDAGYSVFRPDEDLAEEHFSLDGLLINGLTKKGEFTVEMLDLNREQLRRLRELRSRLSESSIEVLAGIRALLSVSIDRLPPHVRARFLEIRKGLAEENAEIASSLEEMLEAWARSHLLDVDPDAKKRAKSRRKYLQDLRAILPPHEETKTTAP